MKAAPNAARAGQHAVEIGCECKGTTLVRVDAARTYTCQRCKTATPTGRTVTLAAGGALPADWRKDAP